MKIEARMKGATTKMSMTTKIKYTGGTRMKMKIEARVKGATTKISMTTKNKYTGGNN